MSQRLTVAKVFAPQGPLARALPGHEPRRDQEMLSLAVAAALRGLAGGTLLADAGVGIGKTFAYLVAILLDGKQAVVSTTTKALQDQLALKDVPFLAGLLSPLLGRRITWATLKGRRTYVCRKALHDQEQDDADGRAAFASPAAAADWERFRRWAALTIDGDLERLSPPLPEGEGHPFPTELVAQLTVGEDDCLGAGCPFHGTCYRNLAREAADEADVVIVNHHLLLLDAQLRFRTAGKAALLPAPGVVVADEADVLPEVARSTLGEQLRFGYPRSLAHRLPGLPYGTPGDGRAALALERAVRPWADDVAARLDATGHQLLLEDERPWAAPVERAALDLAAHCRRQHQALEHEALASLRRGDSRTPPAPTLAEAAVWARQAEAVERFARVAMAVATPLGERPGEDADAFVRLAERTGARDVLVARYIPTEVGTALKLYVWSPPPGAPPRPVIAVSATLATADRGPDRFALFRRETGAPAAATARPGDPPVYELCVPSPFPYRRNGRLYVAPRGAITVDREHDPEGYHDQLAAQLLGLLVASRGRAFALFTSRSSLRAVYDRLAPRLPAHWRPFVQGEAGRQEVLAAFRDAAGARARPPVLFATRSDVTRVDVAGSGLSLVALDRLPFPSPGEPTYAARARQVGRQTGDPRWGHFEALTLPLCIQTVKQAAGRLIRSHHDRGVVALLDRRVLEKGYGRRILTALPPMPVTESLADVEAFFRSES